MKKTLSTVFAFFAVILLQNNAFACAVCYGNPDHLMSKGLNAGVILLLAVILCLLVLFGSFFLYIRHRIKKYSKEN